MKDLARRLSGLPVKPSDLERWILVGKVKLAAQIKVIQALDKLEDGLAARQAALSDTQDLAEELLWAEARLGEMLYKNPNKTPITDSSTSGTIGRTARGSESNLPSGVGKKDSHYAKKLHKSEEQIAQVVAAAREAGTVPLRRHVLHEIDKKTAHVAYNSGENEWYTPAEYIEAARRVMGSIDCDPASSEIAQKTVRAAVFYTKGDDGLAQTWHGNVWMNPPYSQPAVKQFCDALAAFVRSGDVTQACVLINNVTETQYGQTLLGLCAATCFPRGRVGFTDPQGRAGRSAPLQGQMVLYFGKRTPAFLREFAEKGVCLRHA